MEHTMCDAQVFEDLEQYQRFCVDNGYIFDEIDLYRSKSPWGHMQNSIRNKRTPYNQWIRDGRAMRQALRKDKRFR
mgnify:FL=1